MYLLTEREYIAASTFSLARELAGTFAVAASGDTGVTRDSTIALTFELGGGCSLDWVGEPTY